MSTEKTKTVKVWEIPHQELKIFIAKTGGNMTEVASSAIMKELHARGHTFSKPKLKIRYSTPSEEKLNTKPTKSK